GSLAAADWHSPEVVAGGNRRKARLLSCADLNAERKQQKNESQKNTNGYPGKLGGGHNNSSFPSSPFVRKVPRGHPETQRFANRKLPFTSQCQTIPLTGY